MVHYKRSRSGRKLVKKHSKSNSRNGKRSTRSKSPKKSNSRSLPYRRKNMMSPPMSPSFTVTPVRSQMQSFVLPRVSIAAEEPGMLDYLGSLVTGVATNPYAQGVAGTAATGGIVAYILRNPATRATLASLPAATQKKVVEFFSQDFFEKLPTAFKYDTVKSFMQKIHAAKGPAAKAAVVENELPQFMSRKDSLGIM